MQTVPVVTTDSPAWGIRDGFFFSALKFIEILLNLRDFRVLPEYIGETFLKTFLFQFHVVTPWSGPPLLWHR